MSYAIIHTDTKEIEKTFSSFPASIFWPSGDHSHPASIGLENGPYRFVEVIENLAGPGEFYEIKNKIPVLNGATLTYEIEWDPLDLDFVKRTISARIDFDAEKERKKYITGGDGQVLTYQNKIQEAKAFLSDDAPTPEKYPMLSSMIGLDGASLPEVANAIFTAYSNWVLIGSFIERTRKQAKVSVANAASVPEAVTAYKSIVWTYA